MPKAFQIRKWNEFFETHESRKRVGPLSWLAVTTAHDGKRFRRISAMKNGPQIFAAWILICQIAAKCPTRGLLVDDHDLPLSAADCRDLTGFRQEIFEEAFKCLSSNEIGWIVEVDLPLSAATRPASAAAHPLPTNQPTDQPTNLHGGVGVVLERMGCNSKSAGKATGTVHRALAEWSMVKQQPHVDNVGNLTAHRMTLKRPAPQLTAETIAAAIGASLIESVRLNGSGVVKFDGRKITYNSDGLYVDGVLIVPTVKLAEAEYR